VSESSIPDWLRWARQVQSIGQTGLAFVKDPFDRQRYEALRALAAEIVERIASRGQPEPTIAELASMFAAGAGYATPKLDVRGAVFRIEPDGEPAILLVKERSDGCWTLPGGWVDVGETPSYAVQKEVREETGYEVRAQKVLAVLDRDRQGHPAYVHSVWKVFMLCEIVGGEMAPDGDGIEIDEVGFFREGAIPPLSLGRVQPAQIARMFAHQRAPHLPADFD
jgi:ADP-ribose pyrophosphatase YjhB (NUDIX family)